MIRTIYVIAFILQITLQQIAADKCTCSCCTGIACQVTFIGSLDISSCATSDNCSTLCRSTYPNQCPASGVSGSLTSSCTESGDNHGHCTVSRISTSPSQCVIPDNCTYQCSAGYTIDIRSTNASLTASSSIPSGCQCATSKATISGTTMSGSFTNGKTFTAEKTYNNQIQVITTTQGLQCTEIYKVTSGSCLGINSAVSAYGNSILIVAMTTLVALSFFAA